MPAITIEIPRQLRLHTGGNRQLTVEACTLREALASLRTRLPALGAQIVTAEHQPYDYVGLFVNGMRVADAAALDAILHQGDRVAIVPSMAGG